MNQRDKGGGTMESVRPSGDGAHFAVGAFRARVRQPGCNIGNDAVEMLGNRSSDPGKGLEARVLGPRYPLLELHQYDIWLTTIENRRERFLEQIRPASLSPGSILSTTRPMIAPTVAQATRSGAPATCPRGRGGARDAPSAGHIPSSLADRTLRSRGSPSSARRRRPARLA